MAALGVWCAPPCSRRCVLTGAPRKWQRRWVPRPCSGRFLTHVPRSVPSRSVCSHRFFLPFLVSCCAWCPNALSLVGRRPAPLLYRTDDCPPPPPSLSSVAARRAATARNSLVDGRTAMKEAVRDRRRDLRGRVLLRAAAVAVRLSRRRAKVAAHLSSRTAAIRSRVADLRATAAARRRGRQRAAAASAAASLPRPGPPPPTSSAEGAVPSPPRAGGSTGPPQQVSSSSPPPQAGQAAAAAAAATAAAAAAARPRASQRAGGRRGVHSLAGDQVAVATAAAVTVSAAVPVTRAALPLPASGGWGRVGRPLVGQPPSLVGLSALLHPAPCGVLSRSGPGPSRLAQQPGVDT